MKIVDWHDLFAEMVCADAQRAYENHIDTIYKLTDFRMKRWPELTSDEKAKWFELMEQFGVHDL